MTPCKPLGVQNYYLAGVFTPVVISGADHFVVDDDVNTLVSVPLLALSVVYHWNINNLENNSIVCIPSVLADFTCNVLGLSLLPGSNAPQPAAQP